jgi:hypothetical protein
MIRRLRWGGLFLLAWSVTVHADETPAWAPIPADGRAWVEPSNVVLHWRAPEGNPSPVDRYVALLDDEQAVIADPDGDADYGGVVDAGDELTFAVGELAANLTYYWRVDAVLADETIVLGDVWSFATEAVDLPGVVVDYSSDPQNIYLMSPSIAKRPDGAYVVSHDLSGPGAPANTHTIVLESTDGGSDRRPGAATLGLALLAQRRALPDGRHRRRRQQPVRDPALR